MSNRRCGSAELWLASFLLGWLLCTCIPAGSARAQRSWGQLPCVLNTCCLPGPGAPTRAQSAFQEQPALLQESLTSSPPSKNTGPLHSGEHSRQHDANPALPLQVLSEKLDVLRLAFYTAPVSCSVLLPVFYLREVGAQMPTVHSQQAALPYLLKGACYCGAVVPCGKVLHL